MSCSVLCEILDVDVVAQIPVSSNAHRLAHGQDAEAWVWTYLAACLATGIGYDGARDVVGLVMFSRCSS